MSGKEKMNGYKSEVERLVLNLWRSFDKLRAGGGGVTDLTMNSLKMIVLFPVFELQQKKQVDHYSFEPETF